ncbi:D-threo-aldose 1-dehydrogenase [Amycolatopsis endophytica]|uniref:D-threo-aldose 1-dehydrogenase n=1 Tax=Amycolatopsis endophytica TaxID=860233 RepID=A0A853BA96_9PSEU|nr:aldo/keto reductase [Amycolatopsis endophytica]NYI92293.1 D-threo-aldose 1-dehydrogenase [Amycolatopsis endophytica]
MSTRLAKRPLGRTGLEVTPVCVGGGPLGSMPRNFGYDVPAEQGVRTVLRAFEGPFTFLDTSNNYSGGESERRIGEAIRRNGGLPDGFVLSTKVDRAADGTFDGDQVRRSISESLDRLGLDRVPLLFLHDPEHIPFEDGVAPGGPVEALVRLRGEGVAEHLGVAGGPVGLLRRYLDTGAFEVLLTHNRWTLIDRSADDLIGYAHGRGIGVVNGAPFGGGILAKGAAAQPKYAYRSADEKILALVRHIETACAEHGVPLAAAALQFSMRDPRVSSTVVGISRPERVAETAEYATWDIPEQLWETLDNAAAPSSLWQW